MLLAAVDEALIATPRDRLVARQLRRPLLALRELARRVKPDASAQQRLRATIDRLQVAVLAIDEHGRYVAASAGASALIGYSRSELLRMSIFDGALSVDLPLTRRWQSLLSDQQTSAEEPIRRLARRHSLHGVRDDPAGAGRRVVEIVVEGASVT